MTDLNKAVRDIVRETVGEALNEALAPYRVTLDRVALAFGGAAPPPAEPIRVNTPRVVSLAPPSAPTWDQLAAERMRHGRVPKVRPPCAVIGCLNPAKSLGYCVNHYQKFHKLSRERRLPEGWVENAQPQTVPDSKPPPRASVSKKARR